MWLNTGAMKGDQFEGNSENDKISYQITYSTSMYKYVKNSRLRLAASELDGLSYFSIGYNIKDNSKTNSLDISLNGFERKNESDLNYLLYSDMWKPEMKNTNITLNLSHNYYYLQNNKLMAMEIFNYH